MAFVCDKSTIEGGDAGQVHFHLNVSFYLAQLCAFILLLRSLLRFLGSLCKKKQPSTESSVHHTKTYLPTKQSL